MTSDYGKKKFREFAKANRLRLKRGEDGFPIVTARGKAYKNWHLYEGFGDEFVGLYIARDTQAKFKHSLRKVKKMGLNPYQEGDFEACFKIPYSRVWEIAKAFSMVKKQPSNQNVYGLKKWREQKENNNV